MKINSARYFAAYADIGLLLLRVGFGGLMMPHGYSKLITFSEKQATFMDFLGLGSGVSLALVIFAEFFCAILVVAGLFTRLACIPLIIAMVVAVSKSDWNVFKTAELAAIYVIGYTCILFAGPGKWSIDAQLRK